MAEAAFDAVVVGGSFAGLSAAMQLARARRPVCVVDAGAPRNRFAAASHGFFGMDGLAPQVMLAQARAQLLRYPSVRFVAARAVVAEAQGAGFSVSLDTGERLSATRLLLASGVRDVLPEIDGLAARWGASVLHCPYCHGYEFGGQRLGVLYRMPLSLHQAQLIADWGPTTLFLNGHALAADELALLQAQGMTVVHGPVLALEGEGPKLSGVRLQDQVVPLDALFLAPRIAMASPLAEQLGCAFDEGAMGPVLRVDAMGATTVRGVHAAGDAAMAWHNATLAAADGVRAGTALHRALVFGD